MKKIDQDHYSLKDLIAQSFIAVAFMSRFVAEMNKNPKTTLYDFYNHFCQEIDSNLDNNQNQNILFTPGILIGLLFVVVTGIQNNIKKINHNNINEPISCFMTKYNCSIDFSSPSDSNMAMMDFIRHLRNGIAHMRFSVNKNFCFNIEDKNDRAINFSCSIEFDNLRPLLHGLVMEYIDVI